MVNSANIDLSASIARIMSAREFAKRQTRLFEEAGGSAHRLSMDLMFLAHEQVRVMEETHHMLRSVAQQSLSVHEVPCQFTYPSVQPAVSVGRTLAVALRCVVALFAAVVMLEIIDPAPMGVLASTVAELVDRF